MNISHGRNADTSHSCPNHEHPALCVRPINSLGRPFRPNNSRAVG